MAVAVGRRIGGDIDLVDNLVLRCYLTEIISGGPVPPEHDAMRRVRAGELAAIDWLPAVRELLGDLRGALLIDCGW